MKGSMGEMRDADGLDAWKNREEMRNTKRVTPAWRRTFTK
jgi:hypothetical protein